MNAREELLADNASKVAHRFFLRIGQAGRAAAPRDPFTLPLFGLPLILEAEGLIERPATCWTKAHRFHPDGAALADRHYNRRKIGSPQFVPPGSCFVLVSDCRRAVWVTSWPKAEYVKHAWPGAWVNSLFRREGGARASDLIRAAVAHTRAFWPRVPPQGMVSFVDPKHVKPIKRRLPPESQHRHVFESEGRTEVYGYCYLRAGFGHVGYTQGGLWAWMLLPLNMPEPLALSEPFSAKVFGL